MPSARVIVHGHTVAPRLFVIKGVTAAPDVLVMGPDRRAILTSGNGFIEPGWIVYKDPSADATYVDAVDAPAGAWDFVAAPGTSRIASIQTAAGESIPTVSAGVTGTSGHAFTIAYRVVGASPGDTITLSETDGSGAIIPFAKLHGTHGTVRYLPASGIPTATRVILATVTRDGTEVSAQPVTAINLGQVSNAKAKRKKKRK